MELVIDSLYQKYIYIKITEEMRRNLKTHGSYLDTIPIPKNLLSSNKPILYPVMMRTYATLIRGNQILEFNVFPYHHIKYNDYLFYISDGTIKLYDLNKSIMNCIEIPLSAEIKLKQYVGQTIDVKIRVLMNNMYRDGSLLLIDDNFKLTVSNNGICDKKSKYYKIVFNGKVCNTKDKLYKQIINYCNNQRS